MSSTKFLLGPCLLPSWYLKRIKIPFYLRSFVSRSRFCKQILHNLKLSVFYSGDTKTGHVRFQMVESRLVMECSEFEISSKSGCPTVWNLDKCQKGTSNVRSNSQALEKPDLLKFIHQKVQISNVSRFWSVRFQIPTVITFNPRYGTFHTEDINFGKKWYSTILGLIKVV